MGTPVGGTAFDPPLAYTVVMPGLSSSPSPDRRCGTCRFWRPETTSDAPAGWGQCRRMPPTLPAIDDEKLVHVGMWPHTDRGDWCGEWSAAAGAPIDAGG